MMLNVDFCLSLQDYCFIGIAENTNGMTFIECTIYFLFCLMVFFHTFHFSLYLPYLTHSVLLLISIGLPENKGDTTTLFTGYSEMDNRPLSVYVWQWLRSARCRALRRCFDVSCTAAIVHLRLSVKRKEKLERSRPAVSTGPE